MLYGIKKKNMRTKTALLGFEQDGIQQVMKYKMRDTGLLHHWY